MSKPVPSMLRDHCQRGFTIVELLVVIGILSVLIGLLLPAISRSKTVARDVEIKSNMRQVGVGATTFAHNHRGELPPIGNEYCHQTNQGTLHEYGSNPQSACNARHYHMYMYAWGYVGLGNLAKNSYMPSTHSDVWFSPRYRFSWEHALPHLNANGDPSHNNYSILKDCHGGDGITWENIRCGYQRRQFSHDTCTHGERLATLGDNSWLAEIFCWYESLPRDSEIGVNVLYGDGRVEFRFIAPKYEPLLPATFSPSINPVLNQLWDEFDAPYGLNN